MSARHAPRLSIIVPALNEAAGIEACLLALAPLRQRGVEVIVADGGSSDATAVLAAPLADQVLASARGRALQMQAGARAARGAVLLFLHADTLLPENADRLILDGLAPGAHVWGRFDVRISGRAPMLRVVGAFINLRSRLSGIATGDQAMFATRAAYQDAGGFPAQPLMEDIELSRRLKRLSSPLCLAARVTTSGRRWETNGLWRTILLMWRLRLQYWLGASPELLAQRYRR
ncbi:TIGR04283 family arsenosugar biosynthesis glycosyltransferase [Massilia sp. H6]|uniref:TIGR04283 family arsenosugar biosynthesis glycosyltransferase n=1 Tax=Massilia sp. H6 TaxID=2970464 RepID=UPI0021688BEB|nr:TIGR04283 family arsenosugar biosynthesis glycosyltransferase [Massilia sp. H6]UVW30046.1 TIGR04283 family arsenosugar biosynthesis glycosyltransferase [Massilia sp. H6]